MIKTLTLDGLTSVKIKQSAFDMERFCWVKNRSDGDIFISCTDVECTENGDNVMKISAGEYGMIDSESREILYLNGSGKVEIVTSAYAVCPFKAASKGGETGGSSGGMKLIGSYATTYSGTSTSGSVLSDEIELPIDLYENNRILLIRTKVNTDSSTSYDLVQNYSMIKIEIPYDNSKYRVIGSHLFRLANWMRFKLYYRPETNKLSCALELDFNYLDRTSFDIYDMGVIE